MNENFVSFSFILRRILILKKIRMSGSSSSKKDNALVSACVRNPALLDQVSQSVLDELVDEVSLGIAFEIHR